MGSDVTARNFRRKFVLLTSSGFLVERSPDDHRGCGGHLSSSRGFGPRDLLCTVTKRPEDRVGLSQRRSTKVGIDVFPNNFPVSGDFENASKRSFVDQRVA